MKNLATLKNLVLLIGASVTLTACPKDKDNVPAPSRTALLTARSWHLTGLQTAITFRGNTVVQNLADSISVPCQKDDFFKFNADKTLVLDEGPTKCDPTHHQTDSKTWDFNQDQTHLSSDFTGANGDIVELSATTLRVRATEAIPASGTTGPATLVVDFTYTAF